MPNQKKKGKKKLYSVPEKEEKKTNKKNQKIMKRRKERRGRWLFWLVDWLVVWWVSCSRINFTEDSHNSIVPVYSCPGLGVLKVMEHTS